MHFADAADGDYYDISNKASNSKEVVDMTKKYLDAYARTGLRTLCISKKVGFVNHFDWFDFCRHHLAKTYLPVST